MGFWLDKFPVVWLGEFSVKGRGSSRQPSHFSLLAQRKVTQRKGTPITTPAEAGSLRAGYW